MAKKKSKKKATKKTAKKSKGRSAPLLRNTPNPAADAAEQAMEMTPEQTAAQPADNVRTTPEVYGRGKNANAALAAAVGKEVKSNNWMPIVEDDVIFGTVHDASWKSNQNGRYLAVILEVEGEGGELNFVNILANKVMRSQFHSEGVRMADEIAIAYKGKQTGKRGAPYRLYAVVNASKDEDHDGQQIMTDDDLAVDKGTDPT